MLTAKLNDKKIFASDTSDRNQTYLCSICNEEMILVKPTTNIVDHFRHKTKNDVYHGEPETIEHLTGKKFLYDFFKKYHPKLEYLLPNGQISDVYLSDLNISLEFQCSKLSAKEFNERNQGYQEMGIPVLWIFGTKNFYHEHNKGLNWYEERTNRLSYIERKIANKNDPVYYFKMNQKEKHEFLEVTYSSYGNTIYKIENLVNLNNEYIKIDVDARKKSIQKELKIIGSELRVFLKWDDLLVVPDCFKYLDNCSEKYRVVSLINSIPSCFQFFDNCYIRYKIDQEVFKKIIDFLLENGYHYSQDEKELFYRNPTIRYRSVFLIKQRIFITKKKTYSFRFKKFSFMKQRGMPVEEAKRLNNSYADEKLFVEQSRVNQFIHIKGKIEKRLEKQKQHFKDEVEMQNYYAKQLAKKKKNKQLF